MTRTAEILIAGAFLFLAACAAFIYAATRWRDR